MRLRNDSYRIFIKREDLLDFSWGGNKLRIAQEYYADMAGKHCNCMIGYGNARSNLCRVLSNLASSKNIECHIISPADDDGSRVETFNSLIVKQSGAQIHFCNKNNVAESVEQVLNECEENGLSPYYIYGNKFGKGNESIPVRAYVKVYNEILNQSKNLGVKFDYIFLATGTGMTQAGLIAGRQLNKGAEKIIGISVARKSEQEIEVIKNFCQVYFESENLSFDVGQLDVLDEYLCGGYGKYNDSIADLINEMLVNYGIPLDPTYTGKAYYGMLETIKKENLSGNILFLHTGGTPLFFDYMQALGGIKCNVNN